MPAVSVVVPCFNEEATIQELLEAIYGQDFPKQQLEVVIADGQSTDGTLARIETFQKAHPELPIRVVGNPQRVIPAGLNKAIAAARGKYIVRLDAHCVPRANYISRSIANLEAGKGWNVGGVWEIKPGAQTWIAASIVQAASHPLGVGDAFYRFTQRAQRVDTVPFGAFEKGMIAKIGGYDETLLSNEDYEFNTRIRQAGGTIWLDPEIKSVYYARPTLLSLARQYARYGFWKRKMLRRYPASLRLRQAVPPLFTLSLVLLFGLGFVWPWLHILLWVEVVSYVTLLFVVAGKITLENGQLGLLVGIPLAMATMHLSWGGAFLWSFFSPNKRMV